MQQMPKLGAVILVGILVATATVSRAQSPYGIGRTATAAEIAGWNIDIGRDGSGLPAGSGSVSHGREVYQNQCAACHGDNGQGGIGDRLVGGRGTLATSRPVRTVGSYWPYATTLFDFVRRAMPFNAPDSLDADQVYAVSAYVLSLNGIVPDDTVLDAASLAKVVMPNRNGFIRSDQRPDIPAAIGGH
jgi:S-disulfanyl-L-cysteine oxidoreductase SoxD